MEHTVDMIIGGAVMTAWATYVLAPRYFRIQRTLYRKLHGLEEE
jgi:hypothetical protein